MRERGERGRGRDYREGSSHRLHLSPGKSTAKIHPSCPSLALRASLSLSFYFAGSFPRTFCRLKLPKEENILAIRRKERAWVLADIFIKALQPVCPVRRSSSPRQESDYTCMHLCQSVCVSVSGSPSHRQRSDFQKRDRA